MNYLLILNLYFVDLQVNFSTFHVKGASSTSTFAINNSNILIFCYNFDYQHSCALIFS